ncbi:hypothetical protein CK500_06665 [Halorubrum salipaludis]|uniref:DUF8100 domain-containing protein n=1 Tax=Halorubrum salipaludis TaxID=2032630 RepID=A0A2A2FHU7_9EURY|nr:hypothetical protein [Halorubrum salipaludis]PAU84113.1 hypothetical protein CK500_06665 [Halorubrum salipaludis]
MDRVALGQWLSLALVPLGVGLFVGDSGVGTALPVSVALLGLAGFRLSERLFAAGPDASGSVVDTRTADLGQLGAALLLFALLTAVLGRFEAVSEIGILLRSPGARPLAVVAVAVGASLGGGMAVLTFRRDRLRDVSRTIWFRAIGGSVTFGTYLALLVARPPAALLYGVAYGVSRLVALVLLPASSRW